MSDETTTDRLAEIEGQAADYTPPEGWRVLRAGEVLQDEDWIVDPRDGNGCPTRNVGSKVGEIQVGEHQIYIRRIEPEPDRIITPDDVAAEALQQQLETTEAALLEQQQRNEQLVTQGSQQRMQIAELRSEVSHVQGLLGEEKRRVVELETLVADLRAVNAAQEKAVNSATRDKADLQHRLDTVAAEWAQQAETSRRLQIELDAREQVPQAVSDRFEQGWDAGNARAVETIAEWLEPIRDLIDAADNLEETNRANCLAADIMQNLPHIMRSLTGLTDED